MLAARIENWIPTPFLVFSYLVEPLFCADHFVQHLLAGPTRRRSCPINGRQRAAGSAFSLLSSEESTSSSPPRRVQSASIF
jgi:hypothetical protein